uniref:Class I SAM-dependent methyltransferase n=1 Tax=Schlesneria paludicola TaxID=360056 RepID=A0A7C2K0P1_9PLAN
MMDRAWLTSANCVVCPACQTSVTWKSDDLAVCPTCQAEYPVRDGLFIAQSRFEGANDAAAKFYDGKQWTRFKFWENLFFLFQGGERRARQEYMRHLPATAGQWIGVTAVGAGNELAFLPESCTILGIDISREQLRECQQRFGNRRMFLALGEAERLPFADRCVDHAVCSGAFNFFRDPVGALRELVRITRPGGTIIVSDEVPRSRDTWQKRRFIRRFMKRLLGDDFSQVVFDRPDTPLEEIFGSVFHDWKMHSMWRGSGYFAVARVSEADHAALTATPSGGGQR